MRYDAEHKQRTRERVLAEAAKAVRAEGPMSVGVAEVMAKAGLTHGGFYAHFASRDELIAETVGQMFRESRTRLPDEARSASEPAAVLDDYVNFYLSRAHRDTRTSGCPLPFLSADASRLPAPSRQLYAQGVARLADLIGGLLARMGHADPEGAASSALAEMVGAVALARAEIDPARSDAILARSKRAVKQRLNLEDRK